MRKIINLFKRVPFEDYDKFDNSPATVKESQGDDLSQIADKELVVNNNNELLIRRKEKVFKVGGGVGKQGKDGKDGVAKNGLDGVNAYVYIAYASDDEGADFTMTFDPDLDYIAILGVDEEIETPEASDFDGLWKDYKGQPIDHVSFTSTTALSGLPNEPGEIDTYTVWGDVGETINLGTFDVYNGNDGVGGALVDLTDVNASSPSDGQVLTYNTATSKWIPTTIAAAAVLLMSLSVDSWWGLQVFDFSASTIVLAE